MYEQEDKVVLKNAYKTKINQDAYVGPCVITAVKNNGTVTAFKGRVTDIFDN